MKRYVRFFSTLAPSSGTVKQSSGALADLAKIRQEMQRQLKEKLNNPEYKQALAEAGKDDAKNAEALKKATEKAEENFKYSY